MGYTTAMWLGFGEALAAVAGALTGLLFVAVSVKGDAVAASRSLRPRAAQTLVLFMTSVLVAVFLVAPQPPAALGAELLAVAVLSGTLLLILDRRAGHATGPGERRQWSSGSGPRLRIVRIAKVLWASTTEGMVRIWPSSSRS